GFVHACQHPGQFDHPFVIGQFPHARAHGLGVIVLDAGYVRIGPGRDLRQVGDDDDLGVAGEFGQAAADLDGGLASDSGVDLVEDVGGDGLPGRADDFDGEHDAGELTAAGDPADVVGHRRV